MFARIFMLTHSLIFHSLSRTAVSIIHSFLPQQAAHVTRHVVFRLPNVTAVTAWRGPIQSHRQENGGHYVLAIRWVEVNEVNRNGNRCDG